RPRRPKRPVQPDRSGGSDSSPYSLQLSRRHCKNKADFGRCHDTPALSGPVVNPEQFDANAPHRPSKPSPPRAGSKPIHTFNFMQTERILTQRLIFGWETEVT